MSKTFGELLDEYISQEVKAGENISSIYLYMEDYRTPKIVINTTERDYEYTDILYRAVDIKQQVSNERLKLEKLQSKVRQLEKSKRDVEKAIKLLKGEL